MKKLELRVLPLMLLIAYSNGLQSPSPFEPSDSVPSGPAECFFIVNDDQVESLMVTEEEVDLPVIAFGSCELNILAVGGGGRGIYQGGGSGYLQYQKKKIDPFSGITSLNAKAGSYAEASTVTIMDQSSLFRPILVKKQMDTREAGNMNFRYANIEDMMEDLMAPMGREVAEAPELVKTSVSTSLKHGL